MKLAFSEIHSLKKTTQKDTAILQSHTEKSFIFVSKVLLNEPLNTWFLQKYSNEKNRHSEKA